MLNASEICPTYLNKDHACFCWHLHPTYHAEMMMKRFNILKSRISLLCWCWLVLILFSFNYIKLLLINVCKCMKLLFFAFSYTGINNLLWNMNEICWDKTSVSSVIFWYFENGVAYMNLAKFAPLPFNFGRI